MSLLDLAAHSTRYIIVPLLFLLGCSQPEHCAKYAHEVYMNEQVDTTLLREAI